MKKLFYVRHGETEANAAGTWAGYTETPLTEKGLKQAKEAGKVLKGKAPKIDLIISSPLSRTYHTAEAIAQEIGYPVEEIQKNQLFIERYFGEQEGKSHSDFMKTKTMKDMDSVEGAETAAELHDRAIIALDYVSSLPQDNILIVSHGGFGRAFRRVIENLPYHHEYLDEHRDKYRIGNAEIVEIF